MRVTFGNRLRRAMESAGFNTVDLARVCKVSPQAVSRWMKMRDAELAAKHCLCAADALEVDLRQLVTGSVKKGRNRRRLTTFVV